MAINVQRELEALHQMTVRELRARWLEVYGEPTESRNKPYLVRRIIWRMQALQEGDLSERARRRAEELARDADLRIRPPKDVAVSDVDGPLVEHQIRHPADDRLPAPGSVLLRRYKGETIRVRVLRDGFEHEGLTYSSLSAVARAITGSRWNGFLFFGLPRSTSTETSA